MQRLYTKVRNKLKILFSIVILLAVASNTLLPLVFQSLDSHTYETVSFDEFEQNDSSQEDDVDFFTLVYLVSANRLADQFSSKEEPLYENLGRCQFIEENPPYIVFHKLKIDC